MSQFLIGFWVLTGPLFLDLLLDGSIHNDTEKLLLRCAASVKNLQPCSIFICRSRARTSDSRARARNSSSFSSASSSAVGPSNWPGSPLLFSCMALLPANEDTWTEVWLVKGAVLRNLSNFKQWEPPLQGVPKVRSSSLLRCNFWSKLYFCMKCLKDALIALSITCIQKFSNQHAFFVSFLSHFDKTLRHGVGNAM